MMRLASGASRPPALHYSRLATRDELVEAFGADTGLHRCWFSNLADTPGLLAARKCVGKTASGKKESWYCPIEVMHWLVCSRRKRGRPLERANGWRLLRKHFPEVFFNSLSISPPARGGGRALRPAESRHGQRLPGLNLSALPEFLAHADQFFQPQ